MLSLAGYYVSTAVCRITPQQVRGALIPATSIPDRPERLCRIADEMSAAPDALRPHQKPSLVVYTADRQRKPNGGRGRGDARANVKITCWMSPPRAQSRRLGVSDLFRLADRYSVQAVVRELVGHVHRSRTLTVLGLPGEQTVSFWLTRSRAQRNPSTVVDTRSPVQERTGRPSASTVEPPALNALQLQCFGGTRSSTNGQKS